MLEEQLAFGIVVGCSLFGVLWGVANVFFVSLCLFLCDQAI
jgi:hypothetical protein